MVPGQTTDPHALDKAPEGHTDQDLPLDRPSRDDSDSEVSVIITEEVGTCVDPSSTAELYGDERGGQLPDQD
jgi:hypothetical protein